jgi:polyferredoxin
VKEWFELRRRAEGKPTLEKKFKESLWRFVFYLIIWIYGIVVLYKVIIQIGLKLKKKISNLNFT